MKWIKIINRISINFSRLITSVLFIYIFDVSIGFSGLNYSTTFAKTIDTTTDQYNSYLHPAPIVLKSFQVAAASGHPLTHYRLIANHDGVAKIIPFQIDEVAAYEDYVLPKGPTPNISLSNEIFDRLDEISFMASDVGLKEHPKKWNFKKPEKLYKIDARIHDKIYGAVYIGIYPNKRTRPKLSTKKYVSFNLKKANVTTSRYSYNFDPDNYLVVKGIDVINNDGTKKRIVDSSSFYLNLDLKYFLTLNIGHSDIVSKLEAYKEGPIRTIVRVSFAYSFLKLNFEMGMYTEVSFFSNSVILPAIMYNPLDGGKSLNKGSGFYYGFGTTFNTKDTAIETNLSQFEKSSILSFFKRKSKVLPKYNLNVNHSDFLMTMEITPSWKMKNTGNTPYIYNEPGDSQIINARDWNTPLPLGKAPVNLGVYFDLSNFATGEHRMGFRLYFENKTNKEIYKKYANLDHWYYLTSIVKDF
jgi:hypothetical protein